MLKVVVFDGGYGGELFADRLEQELPVLEVIRVIDWRNADGIATSPHQARKAAEAALKPYIGKVDLIILANYMLAFTSLRYFKRKYHEQKFLGLRLTPRNCKQGVDTMILTTKATRNTVGHLRLAHNLKAKVVCLDKWPELIDNGELSEEDVAITLARTSRHRPPAQVVLTCAHLAELKADFREFFGHNVRLIDGFDQVILDAYRILRIPGVSDFKRRRIR